LEARKKGGKKKGVWTKKSNQVYLNGVTKEKTGKSLQ